MINRVILVGNTGQAPETRVLENGAKVARVSLATNESYKDKDGEWKTVTEWHNLIFWRDLAEKAEHQIKKGSTIFVEGKLCHRKYTNQDGVEKNLTDIVVSVLRVFDKKENTEQEIQKSEVENPVKNPFSNNERYPAQSDEGDDLPF